MTLASGRLTASAALLSAAWLTDALDGRAARAAGRRTRLGAFDLPVDTLVGACVLAGLALDGEIPGAAAVAVLSVLGGAFLVLRNPAISMALQAIAYASLLWTLWNAGEAVVWLPLGTAFGLGVVLHRRLFGTVIPAFLRGVATLRRRRERYDLGE